MHRINDARCGFLAASPATLPGANERHVVSFECVKGDRSRHAVASSAMTWLLRAGGVQVETDQRLVPDFEPDEPLPVLPPLLPVPLPLLPPLPLLLRVLSRLEPSGAVDVPERPPEPLVPEPVSGEDAPGVPPPWPLRGLAARVVPGGQASAPDPVEPLLPRSPLFLFLPDFGPPDCPPLAASGTHSPL